MTDETTPPATDAERAAALERRIAELEAATAARLVRAELKAEAVRAGMIDLDGLKLVDPSTVTLDEHGEVKGAREAMQALKQAKPWLFGASSSSTANPPPAQVPSTRRATEMSYTEWQSARRELLRRR